MNKLLNISKIKLPVHVKLTAKLYLLAIAIYFVFRFILFVTQTDKLDDAAFFVILKAFWMGVRFDVVISGYLLLFPTVVLSIFSFIGKKAGIMEK